MFWKNINNEDKLEVVRLKNNNDTNMFAIMLEQSDGTYDESTNINWPDGYKFNPSKSGCIDASGNDIANSLEFDTSSKKAILKTEKASYCYLYFSIPKWCNEGETAAECLLRNPTTSLNNANMEGGMYRYQGTTADNYVCFGTSSQSECLANQNKYLYRIIGITQDNKIKLIKNKSIGKSVWHNKEDIDITWPERDLFKSLNGLEAGTITPIFIDSSIYDYMATGSAWNNKIVTTSWKYGNIEYFSTYNALDAYAEENAFGDSISTSAWTTEVSAKVSLMYIHDYYYAYAVGGAPGSYSNAKTAWIFLGSEEWPMSPYGMDGREFWVCYINGGGNVWTQSLTDDGDVRPVFFIQASTKIIKGTGLSTDPFIIS